MSADTVYGNITVSEGQLGNVDYETYTTQWPGVLISEGKFIELIRLTERSL